MLRNRRLSLKELPPDMVSKVCIVDVDGTFNILLRGEA